EPLDHAFEIVLHRVGLTGQLRSVGMGEARPRLGLELVAGQMLRLERERLVEVRFEIGGALARDSVDEIQRDVVTTGNTQTVDSSPDVVRACEAVEPPEQVRLERLRS